MVDDKRTRHTKERIRNAMLTCLETTTLDRITVMQICKVADINRSTFYAHYANPQELYQYLEKCMTDGMKRLFQDLKNKTVSYKEFLRQFLTYCCENDRLFLALYKTDSFLIKKDFTELIEQYDPLEEFVPKDERTYIFEFYISDVYKRCVQCDRRLAV